MAAVAAHLNCSSIKRKVLVNTLAGKMGKDDAKNCGKVRPLPLLL